MLGLVQKLSAVIAIFIFVLLAQPLHADPLKGASLTLDGFISQTIRNNPTVRAYVQAHSEAAGAEYAARGIDDVGLSALFSASREEMPDTSGSSSTMDKNLSYGVGLTKLISQTGTQLEAKYQDAWQRSQYPPAVAAFGPMNPVYTPSVTLSLTQPLLKNIMGRQDQLNLRVRRIQLKTSVVQFQENVEAFISDMSDIFFRWSNAYYNSRFLRDIYYRTLEQAKLVRKQVKAKVAEESDLYRILEQQENYRGQMEGAFAQFEGLTKEIALMMQPENPPSNIIPDTGTSFLKKATSRKDGIDYLQSSSRIRKILDYSLATQGEVYRAKKNARLPGLNLVVEYGRLGAASEFGNAHGSSFDKNSISGGLNFQLPITNRAARGEFREQSARMKRVEFENERTMLNATSRLEALYDQHRRISRQVDAYEKQVHYGDLKLKAEMNQYQDGRLTLFELLQDVSTYTSQKISLNAAHVSLARIEVLIGELTDMNYDLFKGVIDEVAKIDGK
jgi:outer membrane protein TolC